MNERKFWDKMADRYDASVNRTYAQAYTDTLALAKKHVDTGTRVLALGCGTGIITGEIARDVERVTGIDISEMMIREARRKAETSGITNVDYRVAELSDEDIRSGDYNVVTAFNLLYFIRDLNTLLRQVHEMLPDGGMFLSVTDCLGEKRSMRAGLMRLFMGLGLIPYMAHFTTETLTGSIQKAGFTILESKNLFDEPPNFFIAARKEA